MATILISIEQYREDLSELLHYLSDGGTDYRIETADIALDIAQSASDPYAFWHKEVNIETLSAQFPEMDDDRLKDVAKMLSVHIRRLHHKANRSPELQAYVKRKRDAAGPLRFKKSTD